MSFGIVVLTVGRPDPLIEGLLERYLRLVAPYCRLSVRHIKARKRQSGDAARMMQDEGERLLALLPAGGLSVALTEEGAERSSVEFASWLRKQRESAREVVFVIGGAYGLAPELKKTCVERMSLSRCTLTHDFALVLLVEQIYRACTILLRHPYHK